MKELTKQQARALTFIKKSIMSRHRVPSYSEIATELSVSPQHVSRVISALIKKDEITLDSTKNYRSIRLSGKYSVEVRGK